MGTSPDDDARRRPPAVHLGVVSTALAAAAALMMLWTWTEHTAFAVVAYCTAAGVFAAGFLVRAGAGCTELIGGPLDGVRIRSTEARHLRERGAVLAVPGGGRARYGPDGSGRLVYQGPVEEGDG
ncbi:hypothetical protein [Nocardiopsis halotolerans]|uniref:hypothetical protein n=1 Tax=Nocardiopsis halotolerans TaxID=124252 RepID=UPI00034B9467|nr:hypothetical protein [Nocardiopsis halotolerans]